GSCTPRSRCESPSSPPPTAGRIGSSRPAPSSPRRSRRAAGRRSSRCPCRGSVGGMRGPAPVDASFRIAEVDPHSAPGIDREEAEERVAATSEELSELQERLYAESKAGGRRRVLLVLQGMDTSGKGGIIRHVV